MTDWISGTLKINLKTYMKVPELKQALNVAQAKLEKDESKNPYIESKAGSASVDREKTPPRVSKDIQSEMDAGKRASDYTRREE